MKLADRAYEADAGETVETLFEFMEYEDPEENEDFVNMPISEWVLSNFQAVPEEQDMFVYHHLHVTVSDMDHNRILKVRVEVMDEDESEREEEAEDTPAAQEPETAETPADGSAADSAPEGGDA